MNREMRFGIFSMPEYRPELNWNLAHHQMVELAVRAEELGFEEYWVGEHHTQGHESSPMPELQLACMAEATDTIRLGTGTLNLPYDFQDPFHVAERMAFLDQLADGRINFGYGAGALPADMEMFNVGEEGKDKMWEAIDVIETYLEAEEPTAFDGEFYQYDERAIQVPPYQGAERPTALAGLSSLSSFTNAVKDGHRPLSISFAPLESGNNPAAVGLKDIAAELDRTAEEVGRDPHEVRDGWTIVRDVYVADSKEQAFEEIRAGAEEYFDYLFGLGDGGLINLVAPEPDWSWGEEITIEWMVENLPFVIGSPQECVAQIKQLREEVGHFGTFVINHHDWGIPEYRWRQSYERFAEEVMPAFQEHKRPREVYREEVPGYAEREPQPGPDVFDLGTSTRASPADDD
ncbi:MAG: LLM class flavin-dependent oxidoreductase [Haloarculaceae archaeon]